MSVILSGITIYPIKSCGGIECASAFLEPQGFQYDRRWMVVDEGGRFLTQREHPRMTLIQPAIEDERLRVEAPGMPVLRVSLNASNTEPVPVQVWSDRVTAGSVGEEASRWFSAFLGLRCLLVTMTERSHRRVPSKHATNGEVVSFADAFPLLLISEESLADLNARLPSPVPMRRFRPNLVVRGCAAFAEDGWKLIRIGNIPLRVVKPCVRCTITTVDTETAERGKEPLRTLATFRARGNDVLFGQNLLHSANGWLHVGDAVVVEQ